MKRRRFSSWPRVSYSYGWSRYNFTITQRHTLYLDWFLSKLYVVDLIIKNLCEPSAYLAHKFVKVESFVNLHLAKLAVRLVDVWQIEDGARVAAIHEADEVHIVLEGLDQNIVQIVVTDHTGLFVV